MKKSLMIVLVSLFLTLSFGYGESVPDFSLKKMDGSAFTLSDHLGKKIILIDFWATWCKPCKKLMKKLDKIHRDYKEHVEVITISTDDASAFSKVESYIKGKRYSFMVLLDPDNSVSRIFNPSLKIPFTLMIDKKGKIVYTHTGYMPGGEKELIKEIEKLISKK
ncbi:MAG: TlpA family protein disulfide reductase [bacterium]|nr:TlpA family protein disulfide reductase [bacterium]